MEPSNLWAGAAFTGAATLAYQAKKGGTSQTSSAVGLLAALGLTLAAGFGYLQSRKIQQLKKEHNSQSQPVSSQNNQAGEQTQQTISAQQTRIDEQAQVILKQEQEISSNSHGLEIAQRVSNRTQELLRTFEVVNDHPIEVVQSVEVVQPTPATLEGHLFSIETGVNALGALLNTQADELERRDEEEVENQEPVVDQEVTQASSEIANKMHLISTRLQHLQSNRLSSGSSSSSTTPQKRGSRAASPAAPATRVRRASRAVLSSARVSPTAGPQQHIRVTSITTTLTASLVDNTQTTASVESLLPKEIPLPE